MNSLRRSLNTVCGGRLPVEHGTVALMMRAEDFLGDTWVLQRFADEYSVPPQSLLSIHSYQSQKMTICDTFRRLEFVYAKLHRGDCCFCGEFVEESSCLQLNSVMDSAQSEKQLHLHLALALSMRIA